MNKIIASSIAACAMIASAHAATIAFDLFGVAGQGLLAGNEPGPPVGGSGGEIAGATGFGIFYDDVTNQMTVNVGWGSGNGFIDLSSNVNNQHIHGPTSGAFGNDGTGNFKQTAGIPAGFGLTRTSDSPSSGTIVNNVITFSEAQEAQLFDGKFYINVHTANNPGGEIRGFLVPEPSTGLLTVLGAFGLLRRRQKRLA